MRGPRAHDIDFERELDPKFPEPDHPLGYLAPSVGSFTLRQNNERKTGHAHFVWHHLAPHGGHSHFEVDWHDDPMEYVGGIINNEYWCYKVVEDPVPQGGPVYIAFACDIISENAFGNNDEGYRILYIDHGAAHLWCWDAIRFDGHAAGHDHDDHDHDDDDHDH